MSNTRIANKIIRLFVSSTFNDFKIERQILNDEIILELERMCRRKGFSLHVVDLRYGVPDSASRDNTIMKICLEEVKRCQETGFRLNFLLLMGDRYGWVPLPERIEKEDYDIILGSIDLKDESIKSALGNLYELDENYLHSSYILKKGEGDEYQKNVEALDDFFLGVSQGEYIINGLSDDKVDAYFLSATGQEILKGLLEIQDKDTLEHIICMLRVIDDAASFDNQEYLEDDVRKKKALRRLKERIREHYKSVLGAGTELNGPYVLELKAKCNGTKNEYSNEERPFDDSYYTEFREEILSHLIEDVNASIEQYEDAHVTEQMLHSKFVEEKTAVFEGRDGDIKAIENFVEEPDASICLVHGERGLGKTCLMAKTAITLFDSSFESSLETENKRYHMLYRFVGATAKSSNPLMFAQDIQNELCKMFDIDYTERTSYDGVCDELLSIFDVIKEKGDKLLILVDALDQLQKAGVNVVKWIPRECSNNIKIIVSCMSNTRTYNDIIDRFEKESRHTITPQDLNEENVKNGLMSMLKAEGRMLTNQQLDMIWSVYTCVKKPIYIRYALGLAVNWKSFEEKEEKDLGATGEEKTPDDYINALLNKRIDNLSSVYGKKMIHYTLGFLYASEKGLSEDEIRSLLARNNNVLKEYKGTFKNSEENSEFIEDKQMLPYMVWARVYYELKNSLKKVYKDGDELIDFYHLSFKDMVKEICDDIVLECHKEIAIFFAEQKDFYEEYPNVPNIRRINELYYQYRYLYEQEKSFDNYKVIRDLVTNQGYISACLKSNNYSKIIDEIYDVFGIIKEYFDDEQCRLKEEDSFADSIFYGIASYSMNYDKPDEFMERLHNSLQFRDNKDLHRIIFEKAKNTNRIRGSLYNYNEVQKDYIAHLVRLQAEMKLMNANRRAGHMTKAENNLKFIQGEAGISFVDALKEKLESESDLYQAFFREKSRLYYDMSYINYLKGEKKLAKKYMDESIKAASRGDNIVGKCISECVNQSIILFTSIDKKENLAEVLSSYIEVYKEAKEAFDDNKRKNTNARRWAANVCASLAQGYFLEYSLIDMENASYYRESIDDLWNEYNVENCEGISEENLPAEYIRTLQKIGWLRDFIVEEDNLEKKEASIKALREMKEWLFLERSGSELELFRINYLYYLLACRCLQKTYADFDQELIEGVVENNEKIEPQMGNMYCQELINDLFKEISGSN